MSTADRLRRLRRPPAQASPPAAEPRAIPDAPDSGAADLPSNTPAPPAATDLERLEHRLLGGTGDGLSLKERLERLVQAASRPRTVATRLAVPIEELLDGRRIVNDRGEFFLLETEIHLDVSHGEVPFARFHAVLPETVGILTGEPELGRFDLTRAVFLDTETTGLAGGTGTAAFLVGIGFVDGDRFRVRQYFMRDFHEEPALLHELSRDIESFPHLVTFNGKMFDVPLLEARYRLNRSRFPLSRASHLDLLHPARRLWKMRLESCRLQALEAALIGVERYGDVPGEAIPHLYFEYVRNRHAGAMPGIFEHNRLDVLSLAALSILACQWVEEKRAEDPRDVVSLARVFERAELYEHSEGEYRRALDLAEGGLRVSALLKLADRARQAGDLPAATRLWAEAAESGDAVAWRALAVHHEHRSHDLAAALAAAEQGLALVAGRDDATALRASADFRRRSERLCRKLQRPPRD